MRLVRLRTVGLSLYEINIVLWTNEVFFINYGVVQIKPTMDKRFGSFREMNKRSGFYWTNEFVDQTYWKKNFL